MLLEALIARYRLRGLLIDANLLVGFLIGLLDPRHLASCRATKNFSMEDFFLLKRFVARFATIVTTPHVLTEVSNLSGKLPLNLHSSFRAVFCDLIAKLTEQRDSAIRISSRPAFLRMGLADSAILAGARGCLVLTDEFALFGLLQKQGIDVINFNHLRQRHWQP